jgi:hypothetical protein
MISDLNLNATPFYPSTKITMKKKTREIIENGWYNRKEMEWWNQNKYLFEDSNAFKFSFDKNAYVKIKGARFKSKPFVSKLKAIPENFYWSDLVKQN